MEEITANLVKKLLPKRDPNGHKGGPPMLAFEAMMASSRSKWSSFAVAVPGEVYPIAAARCDTAMVSPAPEEYCRSFRWDCAGPCRPGRLSRSPGP